MSNFKRYDKYKDSGIEWIGEIPEEWKVEPLKRIVKLIQTGRTPTTKNEDYFNGEIQWFTPGDFLEDKVLSESKRKISSIAIIDNEARLFPKKTIIVVGIGATVGKVAILGIDGSFNQQITGIIADEQKVNSDYLYYWLHANQEVIKNISNYTTLPIINNESLKNFECLLMPLSEQREIINFLDQKTAEIDDLIADKEKLIELLQEKRQAVITEAVTKGLNPNVKMKDSGIEWIGDIPEGWKVTKLKYACIESAIYGLNEPSESYTEDGIRLIRATDINKLGNLDSKMQGVFIPIEKERKNILKTGDILVSRSGSLGISLYFDEDKYGKCTYASYLVKFRANKYNYSRYLFYFTKSESFYSQIKIALVTSTISNFNGQKYANMRLPLPPLDEQISIANFLDQKTAEIDSLVSEIQEQIQKLREYRQALIFEAVTGKIDVRDYAAVS